MKYLYLALIVAISGVIVGYSASCYYAYFYPMSYREEISTYASKYDIDGGIVASVANVESAFNEEALSSKGAIGIMQLLPSTAQWLAEKLGKDYSLQMLKEAEYNIELGTYYLAFLIDYFKDERLGICAYNAGQGNVSSWLKDERYSADGKKLDKIPFEETKSYLNKVLNNYNYYKYKYN